MKRFFQPLMLIGLVFIVLTLTVCIVKLIEINKIRTALENHDKIVTNDYWVQMPVKGRMGSLYVEFQMTHFESFNPIDQLHEVQFELGKYSYLHTVDELQDTTIVAIIKQLQNDNHILNVKVTKINK